MVCAAQITLGYIFFRIFFQNKRHCCYLYR